MNSDDHSRSLIPLPDASLALARPEGGRVLSEMLSDTLALARGEPVRKIGEYEWCEPDYRQILLWAEQLDLEPEEVIRRLVDTATAKPMDAEMRAYFTENGNDPDRAGGSVFSMCPATFFCDGRIVSLNWDLDLLPLSSFRWIEGLEVERLRIVSDQQLPTSFANHLGLPQLHTLCCDGLRLHSLELSAFPNLEYLSCSKSGLTKLDLASVPALTDLDCSGNRITGLELSRVPMLRTLWCNDNRVVEIDLSCQRLLEFLLCRSNQLTSLDLSGAVKLYDLDCSRNQLNKLELSCVRDLGQLVCSSNQLRELDLRSVPELNDLDCGDNQLTSLDLSVVPNLRKLHCDSNQIEWLDIRPLHYLKTLSTDADRTRLFQRPDQQAKARLILWPSGEHRSWD